MPRANPNTKRAVDAVLSGEMTVEDAVDRFGVKRKTLVQAVRRHVTASQTPSTSPEGAETASEAPSTSPEEAETASETTPVTPLQEGSVDAVTPSRDQLGPPGDAETASQAEHGDAEPEPAIDLGAGVVELLEQIRTHQRCDATKTGAAFLALVELSEDASWFHWAGGEYSKTKQEIESLFAGLLAHAGPGTKGTIGNVAKRLRRAARDAEKRRRTEEANKLITELHTSDLGSQLNIDELDAVSPPPGYKVDTTGVFKLVQRAEDQVEYVRITRLPVVPTRIDRHLDEDSESVEMAFVSASTRRWQRLNRPRGDFATNQGIRDLACKGLPVHGRNAGEFCAYVDAFLCERGNELQGYDLASVTGWRTYGGTEVFVTPERVYGPPEVIGSLRPHPDLPADAFGRQGTWEGYLDVVGRFAHLPIPFAFLYASLIPVVLGIVPTAPAPVLSSAAPSGTGKTTVLGIVAATFGGQGPGGVPKMMNHWSGSYKAIATIGASYLHLPFLVDDTARAQRASDVQRVVYDLPSGSDTQRLDRTGRLRSTKTFRTATFVTGEKSIRHFAPSAGGAQARIVELFGAPFPPGSKELVEGVTAGLAEHHGHLGHRALEWLSEREERRQWARERYLEASAEWAQRMPGKMGRFPSYLALFTVAAELAHQVGLPRPTCDVHEAILGAAEVAAEEVDRGVPALRAVHAWASAHAPQFYRGRKKEGEKGEEWHQVPVRGDWLGSLMQGRLDLLPSPLQDFLESRGFDYQETLVWWDQAGFLDVTNADRKDRRLLSYIGLPSGRTRGVRITSAALQAVGLEVPGAATHEEEAA
jgi:hypothetical protein